MSSTSRANHRRVQPDATASQTDDPRAVGLPADAPDGDNPGPADPARAGLPDPPDVASALATAALLALNAPSVHNTQPWHWRVGTEAIELRTDERWRLSTADPDQRLLVLSCGAALHQVRVALRAAGYLPAVHRLPEQGRTDLLARVAVDRSIPVTPNAVALMRAALARHTDRRGFADIPVPASAVAAAREAAGAEGAWLHLLDEDQTTSVIAVIRNAEAVEAADSGHRAEQAAWGADSEFAGTPVIPPRGGADLERTGRYAVLYGSGDRLAAWLRAGEALSAVWLTAITHGLSVRPLSAAVEIPAGRAVLHRLLAGMGCPYLVLQLGVPYPTEELPRTPRRPAAESVQPAPDTTGSATS
ncbi:MAG: nitroreductase [Micromonosporaceae bacterium]